MLNVYIIKQSKFKKFVKYIFGLFGLEIKKKNSWFDKHRDSVVELNSPIKKILKKTEKYINASTPNQWAIIQSLEYIKRNKIKGDIVETGVFYGGGLILINYISRYLKLNKKIWGYDTFEGAPNVNLKKDRILGKGKRKQINQKDNQNKKLYPTIEYVKKNLTNNGFKKFPTLIKGDTKKTLKKEKNLPRKIAFLRLDTDYYESTLNELKIFYPRLNKNGVLLIDDYGHHVGCRKAVDEFFKNKNIWLHRVDYTARLVVKYK